MNHTLSSVFKNKGYIIIKNIFSNDEQNLLVNISKKLYNLPNVKNRYLKYYENTGSERVLSRVEHFYRDHPLLMDLLNTKVEPILSSVHNTQLTLFKDKINWKQPGCGAFKPHQDFEAWNDFPPKYFVSCALFADNSTIENGCLEMGESDTIDFNNIILDNENGVITQPIEDSITWKPVIVNPADLVIFNSFVPHRSSNNNSNNMRRVFYFTYNYENDGMHYNDYFKKKRQVLPPDFERDNRNNKIDLNSKYNLANPIS